MILLYDGDIVSCHTYVTFPPPCICNAISQWSHQHIYRYYIIDSKSPDSHVSTRRPKIHRVSAVPMDQRISVFMRPSSLGGGRILPRTLSVCLSVRPVIITERHVAPPSELKWHNINDTHVLFGTRWGPHIVRPSRPHKFLFYILMIFVIWLLLMLQLLSSLLMMLNYI